MLVRSEKRLRVFFWKWAIKSGEKCVDGFPLEVALNLNRTLFNMSCKTEICHIFLQRFDSTCGDKNESHIYASFHDTRPPLASHLPRLSPAMTASSLHHISLISSLPMCHAVSFPDTHLDMHATNAPFPSWMVRHYSSLTQMCELHHHSTSTLITASSHLSPLSPIISWSHRRDFLENVLISTRAYFPKPPSNRNLN